MRKRVARRARRADRIVLSDVRRLRLHPGDVVVLRADTSRLTHRMVQEMLGQLRSQLPSDVKAMVLDHELDLEVWVSTRDMPPGQMVEAV